MNDMTKYKTLDELVAAFADRGRGVLKSMFEYAWDLGYYVRQVRDEAVYGEGAVKELASRLGISESTLGNYASFNKTFPARDKAIGALVQAGISAKTAYSFTAIPDEEKAVILDKMLVADDPDSILATEKARIKEESEQKKLEAANTSVEEEQINKQATPEDVKYAKAVKGPLFKASLLASKLSESLTAVEVAMGGMDEISDDALYESTLDVADVLRSALDAMESQMAITRERINGYRPLT